MTESIAAEPVAQDPAWSVCPICGAVVGAADLHTSWHTPVPDPTTPEETP